MRAEPNENMAASINKPIKKPSKDNPAVRGFNQMKINKLEYKKTGGIPITDDSLVKINELVDAVNELSKPDVSQGCGCTNTPFPFTCPAHTYCKPLKECRCRNGFCFSSPDKTCFCPCGHKSETGGCNGCERKPLKEKEECICPGDLNDSTCPIHGSQPPSPIKGELECGHPIDDCVCDGPERGYVCAHHNGNCRFASPQPQSDWEKDFENTYHLVFGNIYHKPAIKAYISDLLKSQRESYQQEIVGLVKEALKIQQDMPKKLRNFDYELGLESAIAILEQEKDA